VIGGGLVVWEWKTAGLDGAGPLGFTGTEDGGKLPLPGKLPRELKIGYESARIDALEDRREVGFAAATPLLTPLNPVPVGSDAGPEDAEPDTGKVIEADKGSMLPTPPPTLCAMYWACGGC
jgi:hypothetical protein